MTDIWPNWSAALPVQSVLSRSGRKLITPSQTGNIRFTGIYAFTTDPGPLTQDNILYIGIARGAKQSIRNRLGCYLRRMARGGPRLSGHAGADMLTRHFLDGDQRIGRSGKTSIFVRWSKAADPELYEGMLINVFDPPYNSRDEFDFSDAEWLLGDD